jgi:hypothetical protein
MKHHSPGTQLPNILYLELKTERNLCRNKIGCVLRTSLSTLEFIKAVFQRLLITRFSFKGFANLVSKPVEKSKQ